jgi:DNA-binding MarR family transcriptional regulator
MEINNEFFKVPNKIFIHRLTGNEFLVFNYLLSFLNKGFIYPSKKTIAREVNLSTRTIDRTIKSLVVKGFITYKKGKRNISNQYQIVTEAVDPKCVQKSEKYLNNQLECDEIIKKSVEDYSANS